MPSAASARCSSRLVTSLRHCVPPLRTQYVSECCFRYGARGLVVAQDEAAVFGGAAAVGVVVGRRGLAVVPQHLAGGVRQRSCASWSLMPAMRRSWQCVVSQKSKSSSA